MNKILDLHFKRSVNNRVVINFKAFVNGRGVRILYVCKFHNGHSYLVLKNKKRLKLIYSKVRSGIRLQILRYISHTKYLTFLIVILEKRVKILYFIK